jgi:hypothetical protein
VNWRNDGAEIKYFGDSTGLRPRSRAQNLEWNFKAGLTWSDRTTKLFAPRAWPANGIFSIKGSCGFFEGDNGLALALMNSHVYNGLLSLLVGAAGAAARSYQVGTLGTVPFPRLKATGESERMKSASTQAWTLKRGQDTANLTSHAFQAPSLAPCRSPQKTSRP